MTMTVHKLHARLGSDAAIAACRVRRHGIAAENLLHDLGAISDHQLRLDGDGPDR